MLTQCAVEEATNLRLGFKGLTSYSETLSVYATERAFVDGDDTPWSKAFLALAYASRGVKTRFTSGAGAPALMGHAQGKSMLYLEARSLLATRAAGSQGSQNGSISCIALPESLPDGVRAVMAENLIAMLLGMEVASGNDALASHSEMRKAAKLMLQFIPGTDFITSGYGAIPRPDNMFGGGNFDVSEMDDWYVLQRDMRVDGGMAPVAEERVLAGAGARGEGVAGGVRGVRLPADHRRGDRGGDGRPTARKTCPTATASPTSRRRSGCSNGPLTVLDVINALDAAGFADVAANVLEMQRQRVIGDYLQPAAIFDERLPRAQRAHRSQRLPGPGHRLPRRGRALGGVAGPAAGLGAARLGANARHAAGAAAWLEEAGPAVPRQAEWRSSLPSAPRSASRSPARSAASTIATCCGRSSPGCRTRACRRGSCASATRRTAPSSATRARS